jgi:hypothetical protein
VYVATTLPDPVSFEKVHKVMVIAVELTFPFEAFHFRFTNELRADDSVSWHNSNGYFARIV